MHFNYTLEQHRLIKGCINGSRESQKEFYNKYSSTLYPICLLNSTSKKISDGALIEVFVYVFKNISHYNTQTSFDQWLRQVTIKVVADYNKKQMKLAAASITTTCTLNDFKKQALCN